MKKKKKLGSSRKKKNLIQQLKAYAGERAKFKSPLKKEKKMVIKIKPYKPAGYRSAYFKEEWENAQDDFRLRRGD